MTDTPTYTIRLATKEDIPALAGLYHETVRIHAPSKYDPEQVLAWSNFANKPDLFSDFILLADTWVLEDAKGPVGFSGLKESGHIPSLYVRSDSIRQGLGSRLLCHIDKEARERCIPTLHTEASQFSKPLFEKHGFVVVETETAHYDGVLFLRYKMKKDLNGSQR